MERLKKKIEKIGLGYVVVYGAVIVFLKTKRKFIACVSTNYPYDGCTFFDISLSDSKYNKLLYLSYKLMQTPLNKRGELK